MNERERAMNEARDPGHAPSDPRPARVRAERARAGGTLDRPRRAELGGALLLGAALVATGLYLWRRPHAPADGSAGEAASASSAATDDAASVRVASADDGGASFRRPSAVTLSEARILGCHDRGPRKTPSDQCDHLSPIEKALANAVEQSAECVSQPGVASGGGAAVGGRAGATARRAAASSGGTIEYVADVSFLRHRVNVVLPKAGRSVRDRQVLAACAAAVRGAMDGAMREATHETAAGGGGGGSSGLSLDAVGHQHATYRISVTATYRSVAGG